jgi:RNA polymerase sigma-70 factor (ECF subfamily)
MDVFCRLADFVERIPMPFHVWLQKTAYERLALARRKHVEALQRTVGREVPLPDRSSRLLARWMLPRASTPSQRAGQHELARRMNETIAKLCETDREILVMWSLEERSSEEIACILEVEPATARKRYGRALLRLHKLLLDSGLSDSLL